ncbi:hypothetical protein ABNB59_21375 [Paenibacillus larvae]|uniref:Uncharacterized protein n=2 Tax=Paenibacillus larvae TaxID=1464 RepID=A0A6C0QYK6_9BACL|nr:hypothetical protein [Paenibacillus larvae]AVG11451.1 hypothetical protein ERICII_01032 [Paenibacillus larvae subsp. larvae DSM 25430]AVF23025.1 hypothetical protein ERICI_03251 [Paenibacillus larvae subsp. larvae]ETK26308.1 hypothetical protein ERIC1_2c05060 [Paenibacillus larvae subsp. larvae DSM 25719]MCY7478927.1 hypothetical protein [Paenibacillus larvae]MCY7491980.1 hypothetical protein [Paenibacillus larvae]
MNIKKYIACLVLMFSVLYGASGISLDKTHKEAKQPIIACVEIGVED